MLPYTCESYKEVLKNAVLHGGPKDDGSRLTFQAMAEHCRVQKTYLSKVLNHDGHLSEDQLYLALDYLEFDDEAREFTLLLMAWEKSIVPARKASLERQIKSLRGMKLKTESNLSVETSHTQAADLTPYYLDPLMQIIHMYLTIRRFALNPDKIADSLRISLPALNRRLKNLESMGIIRLHFSSERRGRIERVEVLRDNLHLPQDSVLHASYATRLRLKAMERMENAEHPDDAFRFSVIFSASPKTRERIHASFLDWLKGIQKIVQSDREEEVYQINFDLLNWT